MQFFHPVWCLNLRHVGLTLAAIGTLNFVPREAVAQSQSAVRPLRISNPLATLVRQQDDPSNPAITVALTNLPFAVALKVLCQSVPGNLSCSLPDDLAAKMDPNQKINLYFTNGTLQQALNDALDQVDPPMNLHMENGQYVLAASSTPRPNRHKPRPDPHALAPNRINISSKGSSFDEAVSSLFITAGAQHLVNPLQTSFRIAPSVTAFLDPVTYEATNATLDEALTKLLKAVPDQKTPLTFHKEKDVYIITSGSAASKPETKPVAIGLPSYDPEPTIKKVEFIDAHADVPLRLLFKQSAASYVLILPTGVTAIPRVTFAMQQVPLEQAVVHLLRSAPSEPALHFGIIKTSVDSNASLQSGDQPKPEERLYIVKPVGMVQSQPATPQSMNDFRFSFHFQNASVYDALKMLMGGSGMNYALDPKLRQYKVTVGGDDILLEAAISKVITASPKPLRTKTINGILDVKAP